MKNNVVKKAMEAYLDCIGWLEWYNSRIDEMYLDMQNLRISNYQGIYSKGSSSASYFRSMISDEINDFKFKHNNIWIHCHNTITLCDIWFLEVKEQYQLIFEMFYKDGKTIDEVRKRTFYERRNIYKIIDFETERISIL